MTEAKKQFPNRQLPNKAPFTETLRHDFLPAISMSIFFCENINIFILLFRVPMNNQGVGSQGMR
jgi:hypothetical protein